MKIDNLNDLFEHLEKDEKSDIQTRQVVCGEV